MVSHTGDCEGLQSPSRRSQGGKQRKGGQKTDHLCCCPVHQDVCRESCDGGEDGYVHV